MKKVLIVLGGLLGAFLLLNMICSGMTVLPPGCDWLGHQLYNDVLWVVNDTTVSGPSGYSTTPLFQRHLSGMLRQLRSKDPHHPDRELFKIKTNTCGPATTIAQRFAKEFRYPFPPPVGRLLTDIVPSARSANTWFYPLVAFALVLPVLWSMRRRFKAILVRN